MSNKKISRRKFITRSFSSAVGAGLALSSSRLFARSPSIITGKLQPGEKYKVGIIGCGNRSKSHIRALNNVSDIEVRALCDLLEHKMERRSELIKNGPEPQFYTDMEKMFREAELDAVANVLPNHLHKKATIAALEAGLHVFLEKPMALTVEECNDIIATVQRTRKALQIGTQRRHSSDFKVLVDTIRNAPVGKILQSDVNSYRGDWRVPGEDEYPPGTGYWRLDQSKCGGVVYEMGAHIIDANNWIFDSVPVSVTSLQSVNNLSLRDRDSTDHAGVLVRYANNALMNYGGNLYNYGSSPQNSFYAVNGTIELDGGKLSIHYGHPPGIPRQEKLPEPVKKSLPGGDGTVEQWRYFAKVLAGEKEPYPDGYIGRQTIQICEASLLSAEEKRTVDVDELG